MNEVQTLLQKLRSGDYTAEERLALEELLSEQKTDLLSSALDDELGEIQALIEAEKTEKIWSGIKAKIEFPVTKPETKTRSLTWRWLAAAAVVLIISFTFLINRSAELSEIPMLTKTTELGSKTTFQLSDGSIVKLNAGSTITYPESFGEESREVVLTGEAFFEVQRDAQRPFIVKTREIATIVLGTSFNILAHPDEDIQVTVATGKVRVANEQIQVDLDPGEQAKYQLNDQSLTEREVDLDYYLAWYKGILDFRDELMESVVKKLEKWYGVDIELKGDFEQCRVVGKHENESLENILVGLEFSLNLKSVEWKSNELVVITGSGCRAN